MKSKQIITATIVYVVSAVASYFIFANFVLSGSTTVVTTTVPEIKKEAGDRLTFDDNLPKTEACPLNGQMYSKPQREWWEKHRPLGVMIENHEESRPQSGISGSDVVYEAVAEGGITRMVVMFYCQDGGIVGPVRSARTYFVDMVSEYGEFPLYAHVGGANTPGPADALGQIEQYGWQSYNDLNQFSIGFPTFWRDYERLGHEVATEHTVYSSTSKLWDVAEKRKLTQVDEDGNEWNVGFVEYKFKDDAAVSARPAKQTVNFAFSDNFSDDYAVKWVYDKATNTYLRSHGTAKHIDKDNNAQLSAKNIVILFMTERNANDGYENNAHLLYGTKGTGKAILFMDGKEINGTWSKKNRTSKTIITDASGKEIQFNRGRIWFEILPIGNDVTAN